ncbi:MAG: phosphoadenylyl-sulfate reductase [Chloroflexi bacterium]|nr:MAG: phosphoadenylyl-sulfate reductase [Chloroflexota bacterium]
MANSLCYSVEAEVPLWNERCRTMSAQDVLSWAAEEWGQWMVLSCSFSGPAGMVLLDMLSTIAPATPVFYIDTGVLFPETHQLIDTIRERYPLEVRGVQPRLSLAEQAVAEGEALWHRDPQRCCQIRKVLPLAEALTAYDAWITGLRRDGASTRKATQVVEWSKKYNLVKLNPLADWTERDVWSYIHKHNVPYNSLLDQGYRSIGCHTCTQLPTGDDPRSGRWVGFNKTECGLHVEPA